MTPPAPTPAASPVGRARRRRPPWGALIVSVIWHASLVVAVFLTRPADDTPGDRSPRGPAVPDRAVQMVYVPPAPERAPPPPPPPPSSASQPDEVALGPNSRRPDDPPKDGEDHSRDEDIRSPEGELDPRQSAPVAAAPRRLPTAFQSLSRMSGLANLLAIAPPPEPERTPADVSGQAEADAAGARPTFGAPRLGIAPYDGRAWHASSPEAAGRCPEIPDLGTNPDGSPVLATVIGRILSRNGAYPVEGAHLQIMGTTYTTFTDAAGDYLLKFDPKTLAHCRTQYVRVTATGHQPELLVLMIGRKVRSDDVLLRKR